MRIFGFGASNSRRSINKALAGHALERLKEAIPDAGIELADLNDYEMPLYSIDREQAGGIPQLASNFRAKLQEADLVLISFAEHNGSYSAAWKNLFDWMSRLDGKVFDGVRLVLLSASPGGRGGANVMAQALTAYPHHGAEILGSLSFPAFHTLFDFESGRLHDEEWQAKLAALLDPIATGGRNT